MTFEFFKWRPSFHEYERGAKKGVLLFKRPRPFFDLASKTEWLKFLVLCVGGCPIAGLCGVVAYFVVSGVAGGSVLTIMTWAWLFIGLWLLFWILHLVHSLRFYKIAKLSDVEFVPLAKAQSIGRRLLTVPADLTATDYNILFLRYIWADVKRGPYRDVTDCLEQIELVQMVDQSFSVGGRSFTESSGESIEVSVGEKSTEVSIGEKSPLKEIVDVVGGIPSTREIVKILHTKLIPRYCKLLGERLTGLYLLFLMTQPPVLPYGKTTSRSEMREVAEVRDTRGVLDYLKPFSEKMEEI